MTWSSTVTRGVTGPRRPLGEPGGFGSLAFSIPLGLSAGRPFSPLSRAISARWAATVCSRDATLPSSSITSAFSSVGESASRSPGGAILPENQRSAPRVKKAKTALPPPVLPLLQYRAAAALKVIVGEMSVVRPVATPLWSFLLERYWSEAEHLSNGLGSGI